ncbi:MAG: hypothetical protein AAGA56_27140, partial [Myxococcota bacterium]
SCLGLGALACTRPAPPTNAGYASPARPRLVHTPGFAPMTVEQMQVQLLTLQNAALTYRLKLQEVEAARQNDAKNYVAKLRELTVLNQDLVKRLQTAETAMRELTESITISEQKRDAYARELRELRAKRSESIKRQDRMRNLVSQLQTMIDKGQLKVRRQPDGTARLIVPRELDVLDPWGLDAPDRAPHSRRMLDVADPWK